MRKLKLLFTCGILCLVGVVLLKVFISAGMNNFQMENEKIKSQISNETKNVESLTMQINELTSFDKVKDIVKDLGLAYNNNNIIVLGE